ncbi:SRPBCC family protein [Alteromonas facilis]|uniref:SRPBCC family protein n=1 Tax=Alteromonas facilis TaxID=2048004 RepID=UPI000C28CF21|nr:SRPBCC family protein [Alteromonas facilis]
MFNICVKRTVKKPIEQVFSVFSEHGNYHQFKPINESELVEFGHSEKNGEGALRRIKMNPLTLFERIIAYDPPHRLEYRIEKSSPFTFDHIKGEIKLREVPEGTEVIWESKGYIKVPLLGPLLLDRISERQGTAGFISILNSIDQM